MGDFKLCSTEIDCPAQRRGKVSVISTDPPAQGLINLKGIAPYSSIRQVLLSDSMDYNGVLPYPRKR